MSPRAVMISSVIPSRKYSASAPELMFRNGSTAIEASDFSANRAVPRRGRARPRDASRSLAWRAKAKSRADWKRSSGFFSRLWATIPASSAGTPRPAESGGSSCRTLIIVSTGFERWKARWPVSIS